MEPLGTQRLAKSRIRYLVVCETMVADLLVAMGYHVQVIGGKDDQGVDILCEKREGLLKTRIAIQCNCKGLKQKIDFSDPGVHQELKRSRIVRCWKAKPPGTPAHSRWHPKTERLYEEVSKAVPVVSTGSVSFPSSFSVSRKLGCHKIGKIINTEGDARSSFLTRPAFLGQFAGGIFYPPGRFSSERIEIEGDIGDRE
jgi:hypothetical protein